MAKEIHTVPSTTAKKQLFCSDQATAAGTGYALLESVIELMGSGGDLALEDTVIARDGGTGTPVFKTYSPVASGWTNTLYIDGQASDYNITAQQVADRVNLVFYNVAADFDVTLPAVDMGTPADGSLAGVGIYHATDTGGSYTITVKPQAGENLFGVEDGFAVLESGQFIWVDNYVDAADWVLFTSNFVVNDSIRGSLYINDGSAPTFTTDNAADVPLVNWSGSFATDQGVTADTANGTIEVTKAGLYHVVGAVSIELNVNDVMEVYLQVNGVRTVSEVYMRFTVTSGVIRSGALFWEGELNVGDQIRLVSRMASSSGGTATVRAGQLMIDALENETAQQTASGATIVTINQRPYAKLYNDYDITGYEPFATGNNIPWTTETDAETVVAILGELDVTPAAEPVAGIFIEALADAVSPVRCRIRFSIGAENVTPAAVDFNIVQSSAVTGASTTVAAVTNAGTAIPSAGYTYDAIVDLDPSDGAYLRVVGDFDATNEPYIFRKGSFFQVDLIEGANQ